MADIEKNAADVEEEVEEVAEETEASGDAGKGQAEAITAQLMQNPQVLAAIQGKLGTIVGMPSGYIQSLPKVVKRRLKALKKLQNEAIQIESKFYEEVHELECKYAAKYAPLYDRRKEIVNGATEPTDSDCDWPSDEEEEDEEDDEKLAQEDMKNKLAVEDETKADSEKEKEKEEESPSGVPQFWLTIFKNVDMLSEMVQEHDEPILQHLQDIKVNFSQSSPLGFTLEFYFDSNDYFTNTLLTKEYTLRGEPDENDPFSFEGPEIIKCKGCEIDWKKGKNVTVKLIKKIQKHKGR